MYACIPRLQRCFCVAGCSQQRLFCLIELHFQRQPMLIQFDNMIHLPCKAWWVQDEALATTPGLWCCSFRLRLQLVCFGLRAGRKVSGRMPLQTLKSSKRTRQHVIHVIHIQTCHRKASSWHSIHFPGRTECPGSSSISAPLPTLRTPKSRRNSPMRAASLTLTTIETAHLECTCGRFVSSTATHSYPHYS